MGKPSIEILQGENGSQPTVLPPEELARQNKQNARPSLDEIPSESKPLRPSLDSLESRPSLDSLDKPPLDSIPDKFDPEKPKTNIRITPDNVDEGVRKANFLENLVWKHWAGVPDERIEHFINQDAYPQERIAKIILGGGVDARAVGMQGPAGLAQGKVGASMKETFEMALAPIAEVGLRAVERPLASVFVPLAKLAFLGTPLKEEEFPKLIQDLAPEFAADPKNKQEYAMLRGLMNAYFTVKPSELEEIEGYHFDKERPSLGDVFRARNIAMGIDPKIGEPLAAIGGLSLRMLFPDALMAGKKIAEKTPGAVKGVAGAVKDLAEEVPGMVKEGVKEAGEAIKTTAQGSAQWIADIKDAAVNLAKGTTEKQSFIRYLVDEKGLTRAQAKQFASAVLKDIKEFSSGQSSAKVDYAFKSLFNSIDSPTAVHSTVQEKGVQAENLKSEVDAARANVTKLEAAADDLTKKGETVPEQLTEAIKKAKESVPAVGQKKEAVEDTPIDLELDGATPEESAKILEERANAGRAKAAKPAEEEITVFKGGNNKPFDENFGMATTTDKEMAAEHQALTPEGTIEELKIKPLKMLDIKDIPAELKSDMKKLPSSEFTKKLVEFAKQNGYDSIDMRSLPESEIKIIDPKIITKKASPQQKKVVSTEEGKANYEKTVDPALAKVLTDAGAVNPKRQEGYQKKDGTRTEGLINFDDPETKTTLALKPSEINPESVKKKLTESRAKFDSMKAEREANEKALGIETVSKDELNKFIESGEKKKEQSSANPIVDAYEKDIIARGTDKIKSAKQQIDNLKKYANTHTLANFESYLDLKRNKGIAKFFEDNSLTIRDFRDAIIKAPDYIPEEKSQEPAYTVKTAEIRPYRRPDGSVGYEAVPIIEDKLKTEKKKNYSGLSPNLRYQREYVDYLSAPEGASEPSIPKSLAENPDALKNIQKAAADEVRVNKKMDGEVIRTPAGYVAVPSEEKWYHGGAKGLKTIADGWATQDRNMAQNFADRIVGGGQVYEVDAENVTQPNKTEKIGKIKKGAILKQEGPDNGTDKETEGQGSSVRSAVGERTGPDNESGTGPRGDAAQPVRDAGGLQGEDGSERSGLQGEQSNDADLNEATQKAAEVTREKTQSEADSNYKITPEDKIGEGTPKQKYKDNLTAIKVLKQIESEKRDATKEEQAILIKYVGWGGIKQVFDPQNESWKREFEELKNLLSEKEYAAARASVTNAHYTSPTVIKAMWEAVKRLGFKKGKVLEPGMGIGHFLGLRPAGKIAFTGVELDGLTGRIAKQLYQSADIHVSGFEDVKFSQDYYDLAISNVPFANTQPVDRRAKELGIPAGLSLHDFFFAKSLALVRPGGVIAFITSRYTMDKQSKTFREHIAKEADLLGAIRLPNTAFKGNAGAEVVTDVIFLRKRLPDESPAGQAWIESTQKSVFNANVNVNEYYATHPEMLLGTEAVESGLYSKSEYTVRPNGTLEEQLAAAIQKLPENVFENVARIEKVQEEERLRELLPSHLKEGSYFVKDGKIYQKINAQEARLVDFGKDTHKADRFIAVRDMIKNLLHDQQTDTSDSIIKASQKALNKEYDLFVRKYGYFSDKKNQSLFEADPDIYFVTAQENVDEKTKKVTKGPIFTQRVISPHRPVTKVDTIKEGLLVSLNELGEINTKHIATISGKSEGEVTQELLKSGIVFRNPETESLETKDAYLSGNVKAKLKIAERAAGKDPQYKTNVSELEKVIPADLPFHEIGVKIGSPWIPEADYAQFLADLLDMSTYRISVKHKSYNGSWEVKLTQGGNYKSVDTFGIRRAGFGAADLFEKMANNKGIVVKDKHGEDEPETVNQELTDQANEKAALIKEAFADWIWKEQARRERLSKFYNDNFNTNVKRKFDGSHLTFPGMNPEWFKKFRPSQFNAAWRMIQTGKLLLAHAVGSGKTFTMIAASMEMRRLGLIRKPIFSLLNSTLPGFVNQFRQLYPAANLLVADEKNFSADKRETFLSRLATNDVDAILITHSAFGLINVGNDTYEEYVQQRIDDLTDYIRETKAAQGKKAKVSQIENSIKKLRDKIKLKIDESIKDKSLNFEELGIDMAFIDEAQQFKNLMFQTGLQNVAGLGNPAGSDRSEDMAIKLNYLQKKTNGRGVVFATGTPIMNSLSEAYSLMKYLQIDRLKELGIKHFDDWVNQFGVVEPKLEVRPTGEGYRMKTRFRSTINAQELMGILEDVWDIYTATMLEEDGILRRRTPDHSEYELPAVKGGKAEARFTEKTPELEKYVAILKERYEAILGKRTNKKGMDNALVIVGDGRKAAVDVRLVVPGAPDNPKSKLNVMINDVYSIWKETKADRLTQVVFFNLMKPKKNLSLDEEAEIENQDAVMTDFDPNEEMRNKWIKMGIPANEIAFIADAKGPKAQQAIFEKVRTGEIRIIVGHRQKLGIGVNIQDKLYAGHHLDTPWTPGELTQADGRYLRPGNQNNEIRIIRYVTNGSFDVNSWQMLEGKALALESLLSGKEKTRTIVESEEFSFIKAMASDNPLVMEKTNVDTEVRRLNNLKKGYMARKAEGETFLSNFDQAAEKTKAEIERQQALASELPKERPTEGNKQFKMTVAGKEYTTKEAAGKALVSEGFEIVKIGVQDAYRAKTGAQIGSIMGYSLFANSNFEGSDIRITKGKDRIADAPFSGSPSGLIDSIIGKIFENPAKEIEFQKRLMAQAEEKKKNIEQDASAFKYEGELAKMAARQREIDKTLRDQALADATKPKTDERKAPDVESDIQEETKPETDELMDGGTTLASFPANIFLEAEKRSKAEKDKEAEARARDEVATATFSDPEVEKRFKEANGMNTRVKLIDSVKEFFTNAKKQLRVYPELPNKSEYAFLKNLLRKQSETRNVANDRAVRAINAITATFGPKKLDLFTRKVILDDLIREAEAGRAVPYGYSYMDEETGSLVIRTEVLKKDKEKIDALVEGNPDIKEALQRRQRLWAAIQADLVRYKILKASQLKEDYFRHQVLEFARAKATYGTGSKLRSPSPGYAKRREGSTFDINSSYLEAEFEVMAQSFADIETARALEEIELSPLNLMKGLKQKAKAENDKLIREYFAALIKAEQDKGNPEFMFKTVDELYRATLNWKQAIGLSKLGKLAADGDLPTGDHDEYEDFVSDLAENYEDGDVDIDNGLLFKYLNYLMKTAGTEGSPASKAAATVFKGIAEKKAFIIETLGDRFKTWRDFVPDTHTTWQPKEGRVFYSAYSVPQRIVNEVLGNVEPDLAEFSITKNDLKKIMAVGGPRKELVLPQEVADTLDNLYQVKPPNWLYTAAKTLTTAWKKWVLFNPRRFFKYNLQNFIGDSDAVIAGQPKIFKNFGRAQKELTDVFYKNQPMTKEMREFFERGGLSSTMTIQEIPDIKELEVFSRFFSEAEKAKDQNAAAKIMRKYWESVTLFTAYREAVLRYAAYLHYRELFLEGGKDYAASDPIEVDGIQDPLDRAAKVATELLGDYSAVSALTKTAREIAIPFASWLEVNMKRYYRLTKNSFMTGGAGAGAGTAGRIGAVAMRKGAFGLAKFLLRASAMTIAAGLYNQLFWADEEDDITPYDQNRMHLIVGRTKDGRVIVLRGQGAFADALEWFGLNQAPQLLREYFEGKSSWQDVFGKVPFIYGGGIGLKPAAQKIARGVNPLYKWPFEVATGRTMPIFDGRAGKIEDPVRYILQGLQLENEYDMMLRKPSRGYGQSLIEAFVSVQDPEENAYRYIQSQKYEYLEKWKGRGGSGDFYSPNSILYRELKRAIRFGDKDAQSRITQKIQEKGLTAKQVNQSLEAADPLYGLNKADKREFVQEFLSQRDRMKFDRAMTYFEKTFKK